MSASRPAFQRTHPDQLLACAGRFVCIALGLLAGVSRTVAQAPAKNALEIRSLNFGFQTESRRVFKPGVWNPLLVEIWANANPFQGTLELITPDSDGLATSLTIDAFVEANASRVFSHPVKPGGPLAGIRVVARNKDGQVVAESSLDFENPNAGILSISSATRLVLGLGQPAGLVEAFTDASVNIEQVQYANVRLPKDLPLQWFGYDAVDEIVLGTGAADWFDQMDAGRASALAAWVQQGGRLTVSVGQNWQLAKGSFLGPLLPAQFTELGRIQNPTALEAFCSSADRFDAGPQGLPILRMSSIRGRTLSAQGDRPLVVQGAFGFGLVTLLGFDTDMDAFPLWKGRKAFWTRLLKLPVESASQKANNQARLGQLSFSGESDLATVLHNHLESFEDVSVVPFGWVAFLIFCYILIIGPLDYFLVKRVFGRLEWTWITFPMWVLLISVAAYYSAHWLKGNDLRINRVEVVDIDTTSQTLRGSDFLSVFSPRIDRYTLAVEPKLGVAGPWSGSGASAGQPDRLASWLGIPEAAVRSIYNRGGASLFGRGGYQYQMPGPDALVGVPIRVWSVKSLTNRWMAKAAPILDANLTGDDLAVTGSLANVSKFDLKDVVVLYRDASYEIPALPAGATVDLGAARQRTINDFLAHRASGGELALNTEGPTDVESLATLVRTILFATRTPADARKFPSEYLRYLDSSEFLELDKVILFAEVNSVAAELWLNAKPNASAIAPAIPGKTKTRTFLRILIDPKRERS